MSNEPTLGPTRRPTARTGMGAPDPEPFAGLLLDEPLIDAETWERAGRLLVAAPTAEDDDPA